MKTTALEAEVAQEGEKVEPEGETTETELLDPPKSPPQAQKPPSTLTTSPDIIELHRRVSPVNRKRTLMSQHADMLCPGEIINHLQRVEEETKRFRDKKKISVAKAVVAKNVYCEPLALTSAQTQLHSSNYHDSQSLRNTRSYSTRKEKQRCYQQHRRRSRN
jgi:hypothetical protein